MSIRIGNRIISGGKGGNGDTISNQNPSSEITKLYNWVGTIEEYVQQEIATLHPDWVCYIVDGTQIAPSHRVIKFQKPTAENNYTWYRLYDDGWVEQGGLVRANSSTVVDVVYPVAFLDENYTLTIGLISDKDSPVGLQWAGAQSKSSTGCVIAVDSMVSKDWEAKGLYYQEEESGELLR